SAADHQCIAKPHPSANWVPAMGIAGSRTSIQLITSNYVGHFQAGPGVTITQFDQISEELFLPGGGDGFQIIAPVHGDFLGGHGVRQDLRAAGAGKDEQQEDECWSPHKMLLFRGGTWPADGLLDKT